MNILRWCAAHLLFSREDTEVCKKMRSVNQKFSGQDLHVFYATKPFQYVSLKNTGAVQSGNYNILILKAAFINAQEFLRKIKKYDGHLWDEILLIEHEVPETDLISALFHLKNIKELWIGFDVGLRIGLCMYALKKRGGKICVYEEGVGNYVIRDYYGMLGGDTGKRPGLLNRIFIQPVRRFLAAMTGTTFTLGECKWVDEVYLTYPEYPGLSPCLKKKVCGMQKSFVQHWIDQIPFFEVEKLSIFANPIMGKNILVYATSWDPVYNFSKEDFEKFDLVIVKFHPHIQEDQGKSSDPRIIHLQTDIPNEVLLLYLSLNNKVTLRAEYSSTMAYLIHSPIELDFIGGNPPGFLEGLIQYVKDMNGRDDFEPVGKAKSDI